MRKYYFSFVILAVLFSSLNSPVKSRPILSDKFASKFLQTDTLKPIVKVTLLNKLERNAKKPIVIIIKVYDGNSESKPLEYCNWALYDKKGKSLILASQIDKSGIGSVNIHDSRNFGFIKIFNMPYSTGVIIPMAPYKNKVLSLEVTLFMHERYLEEKL